MTNSLKFSRLMAIIMVAIVCCSGCKKNKDNDSNGGTAGTNKLAPPAWIQGSWGAIPGGVGPEVYKFTPDDVLQAGVSLKTLAVSNPSGTVTVNETKKTDNQYDITIKAKASGKESVSGFFSFKKGDGTYIEFGVDETGSTSVVYARLYKK